MTIHQKLAKLRLFMKSNGVQAVIIPSGDPHQSEYVAAHWMEREWISGFTGSAGVVVVTMDHAGLWTDSRYFLQAEIQLKGTEFVLHKMFNQFASPYINFLVDHLSPESIVSVNGFMFSKSAVDSMKKTLLENKIHLIHRLDLISQIWKDRPSLSDAPILFHEEKYSGKSTAQKLEQIREKMSEFQADYHFISTLDDIAWTFNVRGSDVDYNPVGISYAIIGKSEAQFFVDEKKLSAAVKKQFIKNNINIYPYDDIIPYLNRLEEKNMILIDPGLCSQSMFEAINAQVISGICIPRTLKAIKNETETAHIRYVMKKDGAALANSFYWLEQSLKSGSQVNEVLFAKKLSEFRSQQKYYHGESFGAIVGYKENGAIIHYHPEPDTCKTISQEGILLVDSGGQYCDGTTDITRTFALSTPTDEQKKVYTLILKGLIALSVTKFPEGTAGGQLDTLARQYLWVEGLNYGHGTGHGVGFYLNVHEPPQGFAPIHSERGRTALMSGMLTSNEPGYYKEGEYGMRLENLILTKKSEISAFLEFETVTLYPFDHTLIDKFRLTREEIKWLNDYHKRVYAGISTLLKGDIKTWFKDKCRKI